MEARNSLLQATESSEESCSSTGGHSGHYPGDHHRFLRDRRRLSCVSEESVSTISHH